METPTSASHPDATRHKETICARASAPSRAGGWGLATPIVPATSFAFPNPDGEVYYPRYFNTPTQAAVAERIRALENGEAALVFGSGLAAITTALLAFLKEGDHAVFHSGVYGGTRSFITGFLGDYGVETSFVSGCDTDDFAGAIRSNTRLLFLETPTNPLLKVIDLRGVVALARARGTLVMVDNTFATPIAQNPLDLGCDVVVHSGTKYLNGHSDVLCGAVVASSALAERVARRAKVLGGVLDPRGCYLLERGLKTLALRVERQSENALDLARFLASHPRVRRVHYPGLPEHPGHDIAARQMACFGGMLSFEIDTDEDDAKERLRRFRLATMAVSLGGVETLVCRPKDTSHAAMSDEERRQEGIADTLIRVSTGIEHAADIIADFETVLR